MSRVLGTQEVIERLHKVNALALGVVGEIALQDLMVRRVRARFDQGVDPSGSPWPGLMESTIKRKSYKSGGSAKKLLVRTGLLRSSLGILRGSNQGLLAFSTGLGFRIGVTDPEAARYGRLHNYGLGGQEKRQFIGLGASDVRSVQTFLNRRMQSIAKT